MLLAKNIDLMHRSDTVVMKPLCEFELLLGKFNVANAYINARLSLKSALLIEFYANFRLRRLFLLWNFKPNRGVFSFFECDLVFLEWHNGVRIHSGSVSLIVWVIHTALRCWEINLYKPYLVCLNAHKVAFNLKSVLALAKQRNLKIRILVFCANYAIYFLAVNLILIYLCK